MRQLLLDANSVVITAYDTPDPQPGAIKVSDEIYDSALPRLGRVKLVDGVLSDLPPPAPTNADVHAEEERRSRPSVTVTIASGTKVVPFDTRGAKDLRNIHAFTSAAHVRATAGSTTPFVFTGADNVDYTLTPAEMMEAGMQVLARLDHLHKKAKEIIRTPGGIPADFRTNEAYWA